ncbi:MAG TPA: ubiquinone/menaquinone biosynthesis methyltransferase [Polyangia bacterium]|nr:ubiquinone/menaquinone biosynthesis methyltransferase [Polyangia bacterium]
MTTASTVATTTSLAEAGHDVRGMFDRVAGRYDAANRVMSAGVDGLWRRKAITRLLEGLGEQPRLLDLGAGTLDGGVEIVRRVPGARVASADFSREMLRAGRPKIPAGAAIETHGADGHALPYRAGAFDGAFSAFCVRNLRDLPRGLAELRRVVRPGGRVAILEFFRAGKRRFFLDAYNAHVLPLVGWAITGDREAYRYLPDSIAQFRSLAEFVALMREAGFSSVEGTDLFPSGVASLVVAS